MRPAVTPPSPSAPSGPERCAAAPILKAATQETLTLKLPQGMKASSLKWFSVWCRLYSVDFGHLIFPAEFDVPGAEAEPEPEAEAEAEPEPKKKDELPHPAVISNDIAAEPEPEPASAITSYASLLSVLIAGAIA